MFPVPYNRSVPVSEFIHENTDFRTSRPNDFGQHVLSNFGQLRVLQFIVLAMTGEFQEGHGPGRFSL
jgi:hypothetical protein